MGLSLAVWFGEDYLAFEEALDVGGRPHDAIVVDGGEVAVAFTFGVVTELDVFVW